MTRGRRLTGWAAFAIVVYVANLAFHPMFVDCKEKAYVASMKSDLRNLITAQEAYFSDHTEQYAPSVEALGTTYKASSGVTVALDTVLAKSWVAHATSAYETGRRCTLSVGGTATNEGEPVCTGDPAVLRETTRLQAIAAGWLGAALLVALLVGIRSAWRGAIVVGVTGAVAILSPLIELRGGGCGAHYDQWMDTLSLTLIVGSGLLALVLPTAERT